LEHYTGDVVGHDGDGDPFGVYESEAEEAKDPATESDSLPDPDAGHESDHPDASPPPQVVVHVPFVAPVERRHRLAKFDWLNNPFLPRIHSLCLQHVLLLGTRPTHTENTIKCLSEDGLGPSALSDEGAAMMTTNTTDFRGYLEETIPRTNTS